MHDSRICLDGLWEFQHVAPGAGAVAQPRSIKVPGPWQAQFDDLRGAAGIGIYSRAFELPQDWVRDRVFLRFGAVFHHTNV